jgi:hypothetical protein
MKVSQRVKDAEYDNDFIENKFFTALTDISGNVTKLSNNILQPDKFASIFCEAAKTQKSIDSALEDVVIALLNQNSNAREAIKEIIKDVDRNYGRLLMGWFGLGIWTIATLLFGEIVRYFLKT